MNASLVSPAYLHPADLGLIGLIILGAIALLGCVVFGVIFAYILKAFRAAGSKTGDAGDERRERKI
ncbi:MAG TPA: hypothetical protein VGB61_06205 [Pyrinomonadaceae bacterium]|jgi:hypothetical protein